MEKVEGLVESAEISDVESATAEGVKGSYILEIVRLAMSLFMFIEAFSPVISFG